jgi:hypothetical protein
VHHSTGRGREKEGDREGEREREGGRRREGDREGERARGMTLEKGDKTFYTHTRQIRRKNAQKKRVK